MNASLHEQVFVASDSLRQLIALADDGFWYSWVRGGDWRRPMDVTAPSKMKGVGYYTEHRCLSCMKCET